MNTKRSFLISICIVLLFIAFSFGFKTLRAEEAKNLDYESIRSDCQKSAKSNLDYLQCVSLSWDEVMLDKLTVSLTVKKGDEVVLTGYGISVVREFGTFDIIRKVCLDIEAEIYSGNHTECMEKEFETAHDFLLNRFLNGHYVGTQGQETWKIRMHGAGDPPIG